MDDQEKKGAFVKNRFRESQLFGNVRIEEWLMEKDPIPYIRSELKRILSTDSVADHIFSNSQEIKKIGERSLFAKFLSAASYDESREVFVKHNKIFEEIFSSLTSSHFANRHVFYKYKYDQANPLNSRHLNDSPPLVVSSGRVMLKVSLSHGELKFHELTYLDLMLILLAEKRSDIDHYFFDELKQMVQVERTKAEADFDNAIAVSEDGREIVCAEEVFIYWTNKKSITPSIMRFPGESFKKEKIELICTRKNFTAVNRGALDWVQDAHLNGAQVLDKQESEKRVFITHGKYCPSPLPQGGEYVEIP
ncbi:MAG: hypothetical protein V1928_04210 [Parcubacteria group bacterium]